MAEKNIAPVIGVIKMNISETGPSIVAEGSCIVKLIGKRERVENGED